jgi:hypothetical protein
MTSKSLEGQGPGGVDQDTHCAEERGSNEGEWRAPPGQARQFESLMNRH